VRLFSIDGGHTRSIVLSDMNLAQTTLSAGGVVIADDVFNEHWPDVIGGVLDYLSIEGSLEPFGISAGKVYFTQADFADFYRGALTEYFSGRPPFWVRDKGTTVVAWCSRWEQGASKDLSSLSRLSGQVAYHGSQRCAFSAISK
jgi:hypothetical protein